MFIAGLHRMHPGRRRGSAAETTPRPETRRRPGAGPAAARSPRLPHAAPMQHRVQSRADTIAR